MDFVGDEEYIEGVEVADVDRFDVGRVDVDRMDVDRIDDDRDDLRCAVVDIVVDTDPLVSPSVRDTSSVSCSLLLVDLSGRSVLGWLGCSGFGGSGWLGFTGSGGSGWLGSIGLGGSGIGGTGSTGAGTVIFIILQKNGNTSQKRERPPWIEIFGISGGPMGGPVSPILYHIPPGPTAMTAAATAPVLEAWPLAAGRGVVIFSADVMPFRFANVSLCMT